MEEEKKTCIKIVVWQSYPQTCGCCGCDAPPVLALTKGDEGGGFEAMGMGVEIGLVVVAKVRLTDSLGSYTAPAVPLLTTI